MMQPSIVFQGHTVTASEFEARWRRSATVLHRAGVRSGDVVALLMHNSPLALELTVAVRHLGAQWCPINWHFKADEVAYILAQSAARVLVADAPLWAKLGGLATGGTQVWATQGSVPGVPAWEAARDQVDAYTGPAAPPCGAMFFTSGTTGRPKGIVREASTPQQGQAMVELRRVAYGATPGMCALVSAPLYHSAPNSYALGVAQDDGTLFIEPRLDAERTLALIAEHRLTHAYLVPTMYVRMLALPAAVRARYDVSSMRFVASTGSPCAPEVKRAMIDWWGPVIHESYGASELGYMTLASSQQSLRKPGTAGLPLLPFTRSPAVPQWALRPTPVLSGAAGSWRARPFGCRWPRTPTGQSR